MGSRFLFCFLLQLLSASSLPTSLETRDESPPIVDLGYAKYEGVRLSAGVDQFLGMRYAAPPLGDLRFRGPRDPIPNFSVQSASSFGPICVGVSQQVSSTVAEDCLFINVFTPSNATPKSKLPVWFYIQGGGYATNSNANYNGTDVLVQSGQDIILVNFNYRVGALGFLASEIVRNDGDLNAGLLDQRQALQWVQQNIEKFGGDPNHVVIHGASAGAGSVAHHLTAFGGRNDHLFVGAVPESTFWPTERTVAEMEFQFQRFVEDTGCSQSDALSCLRSADIATIQAANVASPFPGGSSNPLPLWYFLPVIDGDLITDELHNLFEQGKLIRVPLLVGDDTNEGSIFAFNAATSSDVAQFMKNNYPNLSSSQLDAINKAYPLMAPLPEHAAFFPSASAAYGDSTFTCPGNLMAESLAKFFSPDQVFNYRYNVLDPGNVAAGLGVPHTFETAAIFGPGFAGAAAASYFTTNAAIVPVTMDYFISFVKALDPNPYKDPSAPEWQPFGFGQGQRLKIQTNATSMESVPQSLTEDCLLWNSLAPTMEV